MKRTAVIATAAACAAAVATAVLTNTLITPEPVTEFVSMPTTVSDTARAALADGSVPVHIIERVNALGSNSADISVRACTARTRDDSATEAAQAAEDRDTAVYHSGQAFGRAGTSDTTMTRCLDDAVQSVVITDLDEDLLPEVVTLRMSGAVEVAWNNGGVFSFAPVTALSYDGADINQEMTWSGGTPGSVNGNAFDSLRGLAAVDANGDGHMDLVTLPSTTANTLTILLGDGTRTLDTEPVTVETGKDPGVPETVTVEDVNRDGIGDLVVAIRTHMANYSAQAVRAVRYFESTGGDAPYYRDETEKMPVNEASDEPIGPSAAMRSRLQHQPVQPFTIAMADFDGDDDLDIFLGGEVDGSRSYRNDGDRWVDNSKESGAFMSNAGMGSRILDVNNDGHLDIFSTENTYESYRCGYGTVGCGNVATGNILFVNDGTGVFTDQADKYGLLRTGFAWGYSSTDLNADGYADFFIGTGEVASEKAQDAWEGSFHKPYLLLGGPNGWTDHSGDVLRNLTMPGASNVVGSADFDGDFRADLLVLGRESSAPYLLLNRTEGGNTGALIVRGSGASPKHGESALVTVRIPNRPAQTFTVPGQLSNYHLLATGIPIPIGFGDATEARVDVKYPSGERIARTIYPGRVNVITEPS